MNQLQQSLPAQGAAEACGVELRHAAPSCLAAKTVSPSTLIANVSAGTTTGKFAGSPVRISNAPPCMGHSISSPTTSPSERGASSCVHMSWSAKNSPSRLTRATGSFPTSTYITSPGLRSLVLATSCHSRFSAKQTSVNSLSETGELPETLQRVIRRRDAVDSGFEHLESEHGALHTRRTDRNAQLFEQILAADRFHLIQRLTVDHLHEDRRCRLADGTTAPREPDVADTLAVGSQVDSDLVSTQRVDVFVRIIRGIKRSPIPGVAIVVENRFAIQAVGHVFPALGRKDRPRPIEPGYEAIHVFIVVVHIERSPRRADQPEPVHQRLAAMMTGAHRNVLLVQDGRHVVRVDIAERQGDDARAVLRIARTIHAKIRHIAQPLQRDRRQLALMLSHGRHSDRLQILDRCA